MVHTACLPKDIMINKKKHKKRYSASALKMSRKEFHLQANFSRIQLAPNTEIKIKLVSNYNTANKMLYHRLILNTAKFPRFGSHKEQRKTVLNRTAKVFEERMVQRMNAACLSKYSAFSIFPSILKASNHSGERCIDGIHKTRYLCI